MLYFGQNKANFTKKNAKKGCVIFCQICWNELVDKFDKLINLS